jgi:hypothetical protein
MDLFPLCPSLQGEDLSVACGRRIPGMSIDNCPSLSELGGRWEGWKVDCLSRLYPPPTSEDSRVQISYSGVRLAAGDSGA